MSGQFDADGQIDLFAELTVEQQRLRDALVCLRDAVPTALEAVVDLRYRGTGDTRSPSLSKMWMYCVCEAGLRFTSVQAPSTRKRSESRGWTSTAHLLSWAELTELIGQDRRRTEIAAWVNSLPLPRWKRLMRPHELWPEPNKWHPDYLRHDHDDEHWTGRRHAWQLVLDLLTDAIERVTTPEENE